MIILILAALLAGYFFIKKFNAIDNYLFASAEKNYTTFGQTSVLLAGGCGALFFAGTIMKMIGINLNVFPFQVIACVVFAMVMSINIYRSIEYMSTWPSRIGKLLFLVFSTCLGAAMGAAGSIVVLIVVTIVVIVLIIGLFTGGMLSGAGSSGASGSEGDVRVWGDGMGTDRLRHVGGGQYVDDSGKQYTSHDNGTFTRT